MSKQERSRKSAPHNRVKSFVSTSEEAVPTSKLDADEMARFQAIIGSRERETWTPADIGMATKLAELEIEWHRERELVKREGSVIDDKMNPRVKVCEGIFAQINRARRDLGLSASQRGVSGHKQAKRNQQDVKSAAAPGFGGLISMPNGKA